MSTPPGPSKSNVAPTSSTPPRPLPRSLTPKTPSQNTIPPANLVIRFSQSLPDISLTVPHTLKVRRLKSLIRRQLPHANATHGLRLIHNGRLLDDSWSVDRALRLRHGPRVSLWREGQGWDDEAGSSKGKGRAIEEEVERVYVHCSISAEPVSPGVLAREEDGDGAVGIADESDEDGRGIGDAAEGGRLEETVSRPVGFDRLLAGTTGFSRADIASLRAQFISVVSSRHTPDTMPSPTSLRRMEDNWLDTESFAAPTGMGGAAGEAGGPGMGDDEDTVAAMWDSFYGCICGFFWPLGALAWGLREEGVWSRRRSFAVLAGVGVNVMFGLVRILS